MTTTATPPRVAVLMGSDSDWDVMSGAVKRLEALGIGCDTHVMSAHRTPQRVSEYVSAASRCSSPPPAPPPISPASSRRTPTGR
jgi:5-(carboxyamino)imidazole ribonucleotide mutase